MAQPGRDASVGQGKTKAGREEAEIDTTQSLQELQNLASGQAPLDLAAARLVKKIFGVKNLILALLDEDYPTLLICKLLGEDDAWQVEDSLHIDKLPQDGESWEQALIDSTCADLNILTGEQRSLAVFLPLSTHNAVLGAFLLIEPNERIQDPYWKALLETIGVLTAEDLYRTRVKLQMDVSYAELEARSREITNSRNTLRSLFDSIPSSVYIIDHTYTLIAINKARSQRAGLIPQKLVGRKCYEALFGGAEPCADCLVEQTLETSKITNRIKREWAGREKYHDWEITSFPVSKSSGGPRQAILFEEDVTEKRSLEANLIQSEKLAAIGQLAAGVAHEINNPLAAVIANAQILKRELRGKEAELEDTAQLIETAGLRASQVVNNLLGFARRESNLEFESFSLNNNIHSAISLVRHELANRSIQLDLDLAEDLPDIVASRNHLLGVWINLLVNAMDAIERPDGRIAITSAYGDHQFKVTVEDNGHGIPKEHLARIFEPFYTTKVVGRGTGLGLSLCRQVIKEHDGELIVDSTLNEGTRFCISLPDINRTSA